MGILHLITISLFVKKFLNGSTLSSVAALHWIVQQQASHNWDKCIMLCYVNLAGLYAW